MCYFSIIENGQERVEVEEDGQLKSLTVNGKEQLLRLDNKWSLEFFSWTFEMCNPNIPKHNQPSQPGRWLPKLHSTSQQE